MVILFDISKKLRANTIAMERVGAAVRMSVRTSAILIENCHGLNQTLRANAGIVIPLLHDDLLPDPLQYMIQQPFCSTVWDTDCAVTFASVP
jgi:hypothetical protein